MDAEKASQLAEKLVRVAVDNGATEHERASAALKACSLISEHRLLGKKDAERVRVRRGPRASDIATAVIRVAQNLADQARKPSQWRSAIAPEHTLCAEEGCLAPIVFGERCWRRTNGDVIEFLHADCWTQ